MGALPRPDLPAGAHRDLVDALHDLHHRAGWPSLRRLAAATGVSHTTVSHAFSRPTLPSWGTLEVLVGAMDGEVDRFHDLWLLASDPAATTASSAPRVAGRRAELAAVRRHVEGRSGLLLVTGEAGIGKTTLLTASLRTTDAFAAVGACLPLSADVPMLPLIDAFRSLLEAEGGRRMELALAACAPHVPLALAPMLPELGEGEQRGEQDEWTRQRLFGAIRALLQALAEQEPFVLLVEDLHWADLSTLAVLDHLLSRDVGCAVIGSWRSDDRMTAAANQDWWARARRNGAVRLLDLAPLTKEETAEQLALLGQPSERLDAVYERTRGLPLFTDQVVAHGEDDSRALSDLFDSRMGELEGRTWDVARILGVAARPLRPEVVAAALGVEQDELTRALRPLAERHALSDHESDGMVALRHPLLAEAVRRRLVPGELAGTNRRLALAMEVAGASAPAEVAALWEGAGDLARELPWRVRAADAAGRWSAPQEAAKHWKRSLDIWPRDVVVEGRTKGAASYEAAEALERAGRLDETAACLTDALASDGPLSAEERFELMTFDAALSWAPQGPDEALRRLDDAVQVLGPDPSAALVAKTLPLRANLLAAAGRYDESVAQLDLAIATGDPGVVSAATVAKLWHLGVGEGDLAGALRCIGQAREAGAGVWGAGREVGLAMMHTDVLLIHGRPVEEVESAGRAALDVIRSQDLHHIQANMVRANVVEALVRAGRVTVARELVPDRLLLDSDFSVWPLRWAGARVAVPEGRLDEALAAGDQMWQHDSLTELGTVMPRVEALLWLGRHDEAHEMLTGVVEESVPTDVSRFAGEAFAMLARLAVMRAGRDAARAAEWHGRLAALRERARIDPLGAGLVPGSRVACTAQWEADMGSLAGHPDAASWSRAVAAWDRLGRPHDAAYCRWRGAQVALDAGQGTAARRLLARAGRDAREHEPLRRAIAGILRELDGPTGGA